MTTIKRLTGIARSGFEPMGAYGGIPTRRELGGWKRMAPCWKSARRLRRGEIHTRRWNVCTSFSAEREVEECGTDFWAHICWARECREELFPGSEISSSRTTYTYGCYTSYSWYHL